MGRGDDALTRPPASTSAAAHARIDELIEELGVAAADAHDTYRDMVLNLAVALHHRRDPDASCWHALYVLLTLELSQERTSLGEPLKRFLTALDEHAAARSPDIEHGSPARQQALERRTERELRRSYAELGAALPGVEP